MKYTASASFYRKGQGEVQFSFKPPTWSEGTNQRVERQGAIIVEAARSVPDSERSDWENKIMMGLGFNDFGAILTGLRTGGKVDLFHKHPSTGHTSKFAVEPGQVQGTYKLTVSGRRAGDKENGYVNIFLNTADVASVVNLVEFAIPRVLGWGDA